MIRGQKLWAGRGSGLSLAGERSAWQPLPTGWLGREPREVRGSGRAVGDSCPCASSCRSVLAALFPGEMKHDRCAEYTWSSGGKVTSVFFLGRGAAPLPLGECRSSRGCHTPPLSPHVDLGCFISAGGGGSRTHCCTSLSWSQPVWAFPSAALCSCQREIPSGFLGFGGLCSHPGLQERSSGRAG